MDLSKDGKLCAPMPVAYVLGRHYQSAAALVPLIYRFGTVSQHKAPGGPYQLIRGSLVHFIIHPCPRTNILPPPIFMSPLSHFLPFLAPLQSHFRSLHSKGPKLAKVTDNLFAIKTFPNLP